MGLATYSSTSEARQEDNSGGRGRGARHNNKPSLEVLGCDCHPRHNHGRLSWDRFLLADGFELCFCLPASPLIISFCFFPMTDESARGKKNQRDKFCSVSAAQPPLTSTSLFQIYTRGPEPRGEYSLVVQPVVCTKGTNQSSSQKVWQSAVILTTDNGKAFQQS